MKTSLILMVLTLGFTSSAFPGVGGSHGGSTLSASWSEIKRSPRLEIASPQIHFVSQEKITVAVDVMEVCVSGDTLRTINARSIYTGDDKKDSYEILERSRTYMAKVPSRKRNAEEISVKAEIPLRYEIDIMAKLKDRSYKLFSKDYIIPECNREGEALE
nr:hypothetical protein BHI3_01690 [Bacteriovorax sp. HI3]